jgi:hypothetical protein
MSVSGVSGSAAAQPADAAESARTVITMKKEMDVQKAQAAALLALIQPEGVGQRIDVRA